MPSDEVLSLGIVIDNCNLSTKNLLVHVSHGGKVVKRIRTPVRLHRGRGPPEVGRLPAMGHRDRRFRGMVITDRGT